MHLGLLGSSREQNVTFGDCQRWTSLKGQQVSAQEVCVWVSPLDLPAHLMTKARQARVATLLRTAAPMGNHAFAAGLLLWYFTPELLP